MVGDVVANLRYLPSLSPLVTSLTSPLLPFAVILSNHPRLPPPLTNLTHIFLFYFFHNSSLAAF